MSDIFADLQAIQSATLADAAYRESWLRDNAQQALSTGKVRYQNGYEEPLTQAELQTLAPLQQQAIGEQMNGVAQTVNADLEYRQKFLDDNWMRLSQGVDTQQMLRTFDDVDANGQLLRESQPRFRNRIPKVKYPTGYEEPVNRDELEYVLAKRAEYVQQLVMERPGEAMSGVIRRPIGENESFQRDATGKLVPSMYRDVPLELTPAERLTAAQEHYRRSTAEGNDRSTTSDPMYWVKRLPFVGDSMRARLALDARQAVTRIADDERNGTSVANEKDYMTWASFQENARVEAERSGKWPTWWLDTMTAVPGYVGEFVATAGMVNPISRGVAAAGIKKLGTSTARQFVARAGGTLVGEGLARTALRPGSVVAKAEQYRMPDAHASFGATGAAMRTQDGMGAGEAYARGAGLTAAENVSEAFLGDVVAPLLPKNMPKILKFALGDAEKGTLLRKIQDKTKINGILAEDGDEYMNDILSYPLQTKDERQRNVVDAVLRGDWEAVGKDFIEKQAVLVPTVGVSHGIPSMIKRALDGPQPEPKETSKPASLQQSNLPTWIGTARQLTESERYDAYNSQELAQPMRVNELAATMRGSLGDPQSRTKTTYAAYGERFAATDPQAAQAIVESRRASLAKIREHFPAFPDVSGLPGDPDVRRAFVDGIKKQLADPAGIDEKRQSMGLGAWTLSPPVQTRPAAVQDVPRQEQADDVSSDPQSTEQPTATQPPVAEEPAAQPKDVAPEQTATAVPVLRTFKTSKGSTYSVHEDGTTTRNKAARNEPGHEGDFGVKDRSARTIYLDTEGSGLSSAGLTMAPGSDPRVEIRGSTATLTWVQAGRRGAGSVRNVQFSTTPAVGKYPLELWKRNDADGVESYRGMHAGNQIVEVSDADATPPVDQPVTETTPPPPGPAPLEPSGEVDSDEPPAGMTDQRQLRTWRRMRANAKKKSSSTTPPSASPSPVKYKDDWDAFQKDPSLSPLLDMDAGVSEGVTIRQHTQQVLDNYDANVDESQIKEIGDKIEMPNLPAVVRAAIALHDIGKGQAVQHGQKSQQHKFTSAIAERSLKSRGYSDKEIKVAMALISHDTIGRVIQGKMSPSDAAKAISDRASSAGMTASDFLKLNTLYYKSDAGAYPALRDSVFAKNGSKLFVAKERFGILEEIIHGSVQETPWLASPNGAERVEPEGGSGNRGNAKFVHGTAIEFAEFSEDRDSGANRLGPGVYVVDSKDADVAEHYARRAARRIMQIFDKGSREKINGASKERLQLFINFAERKQAELQGAGNASVAAAWGRAKEILQLMYDDKFRPSTLEVEFTPKSVLDFGSDDAGGRVMSDVEIQAIASRLGEVGVASNRAINLYDELAKKHGKTAVNKAILAAGYDSIHFIHKQGGYKRPYSVFVILNHSEAKVAKSPTPADANASTASEIPPPVPMRRTVRAPLDNASEASALRARLAEVPSLSQDQRDLIIASISGRSIRRGQRLGEYLKDRVAGLEYVDEEGERRAITEVTEDGRAIIRAFKGANVNDFMRELAGIWRDELTPEDMRTAETFAGVQEGVWTQENHDKFTDGFLRWLKAGGKKGSKVASTFARLANMLRRFFRSVLPAGLKLDVTDDIAQLYESLVNWTLADRQVSMEQAIRESQTPPSKEEKEDKRKLFEYREQLDARRKGKKTRLDVKSLKTYIAELEAKAKEYYKQRNKPITSAQTEITKVYNAAGLREKIESGVIDGKTVEKIPFDELPPFVQSAIHNWATTRLVSVRNEKYHVDTFEAVAAAPASATGEQRRIVFEFMVGAKDNRPLRGVPDAVRDSMPEFWDAIARTALEPVDERNRHIDEAIGIASGLTKPRDQYDAMIVGQVKDMLAAKRPDGVEVVTEELPYDPEEGKMGGETTRLSPVVETSSIIAYLEEIRTGSPTDLYSLPDADLDAIAEREAMADQGDAGDTDFGFGGAAEADGDASFDFGGETTASPAEAPPSSPPTTDDAFTMERPKNAPSKPKGPEVENGPTVTPALFTKGGLPGQTSVFDNPDMQYDDVKTKGRPDFTKTPKEIAEESKNKSFFEMTADEKSAAADAKIASAGDKFRDLFKSPPMTAGLDPRYIAAAVELAQGAAMKGVATFEKFVDFVMEQFGPDNTEKLSNYLGAAWEVVVEDSAPGGEFAGMDLKDPVVDDAAAVVKKVRTRRESQPKPPAAKPPAPPAKTSPPAAQPAPAVSKPVDDAKLQEMARRSMRVELASTYGIQVEPQASGVFHVYNAAKLGSLAFTANKDAIKRSGASWQREIRKWLATKDPTKELYDALRQEAPKRGAPGYTDRQGLPDGVELEPDGRLANPSVVRGHEGEPPQGQFITARWKYTEPVEIKTLSPALVRALRPDQQQGAEKAIQSMLKNGGFLLADGPGVGKSRQILAVAKHFADTGKKVLIVSVNEALEKPFEKDRNELGGSYKKDAEAMGIPIQLIGAKKKLEENRKDFLPGGIYVTAYHRGKFTDGVLGEGRRNEEGLWRMVDGDTVLILDESHTAKNLLEEKQTAVQINGAINNAAYVMFATATPGDKVYHMAYLKRSGMLLGMSQERWAEAAGLVAEHDKQGRPLGTWVVKPGMKEADSLDRLSRIWDHMTRQNMMIKRELSLDGVDVEMMKVALPQQAHDILRKIEIAVEEAYGNNRKILLTHWRVNQEPFKVAAAMQQIKNELEEGRQVVVFGWRVNENETSIPSKDPVTGEKVKIPIAKSEGTLKQLGDDLKRAGIPYAELFGGSHAQTNVEKFQSGAAQVILATPQSGGTGINLDDVTGDAPRTVIVMTLPQDATSLVQMLGRTWRATTKSGVRVKFLVGNTEIDDHAQHLIAYKMRTLNAFVRGEVGKFDPANAPNLTELESPDDEITRVIGRDVVESGATSVSGNTIPLNMDENRTRDGRKVQVFHPMNIIAQMREIFSLPVLRGRTQSRSKNSIGEYNPHSGTVAMKEGREDDFGTATHELAHHIDAKYKLTQMNDRTLSKSHPRKGAPKLGADVEAELQSLDYDPAEARAFEGLAEFLRLWMGMPDAMISARAPKVYKWWMSWLDANKDDARKLNLIRGMVRDYVDATPRQRAKVHRAWQTMAPIGTPPKLTREVVANSVERVYDAAITTLMEKARVLAKMGDDYQRRGGMFNPAEGFLHPAVQYEAIDMASQSGFAGFSNPITSPDGKRVLSKSLVDIITDSGFDLFSDVTGRVMDYYQAVRIKRLYDESGGKYNPPGGIEQVQRNIDIVENDPQLAPKAKKFTQELTDYQNAFMQWMREMGAISTAEEQMWLDAHGEDYVSLMREIPSDFMLSGGSKVGAASAGRNPYQRLSESGSGAPLIHPIAAIIIKHSLGIQYAHKRRTEQAILRMITDANVQGMGDYAQIVRPTVKQYSVAIDAMLSQLDAAGLLRFPKEVLRGVNMIRAGAGDSVPMTHLKMIAKEFKQKVKWSDQAAVDAFIDDIENDRIQGLDEVPDVKGDLTWWEPVFKNDPKHNVIVMRDAEGSPKLVRLNQQMHDLLSVTTHEPPGFVVMMANMMARGVTTGAVAANPAWAVGNIFADLKGSTYNAREQKAGPLDVAKQLATFPLRVAQAMTASMFPNASRKAMSKALQIAAQFSKAEADTKADQIMGGLYWKAYEAAGFTTGHAVGTNRSAVQQNLMRIFGVGLGRRLFEAAKAGQLATLVTDIAGAGADYIAFSDSMPRFAEFMAAINNDGFFESKDGKWVKRTFDASGKVVGEEVFAALPNAVLTRAQDSARNATTNVWRGGTARSKIGKALGPFLWSAFAGTNMLRRNIEGLLNHPDPEIRRRIRMRFATAVAVDAMATALAWLANHDEDWYVENLQDDARVIYRYHNFTDSDGRIVFSVKRGYNYSPVSIAVEGLLNAMENETKGSGKQAASEMLAQVMNPIVADQIPHQNLWQMISQLPGIGPYIGTASNIGWDGREIVPVEMQDRIPGAQVRPTTNILARKLGELFPRVFSPLQTAYFFDQSLGGIPTTITGTAEALKKGYVMEAIRRLFLSRVTRQTENQQSVEALFDRQRELRALEASKEWAASNGVDLEEPDTHEAKVIAYSTRMISAIGKDNQGFTRAERFKHDALKIGTARAAISKPALKSYPDAFRKETELPTDSIREQRDKFLLSFVRMTVAPKPTTITPLEKTNGVKVADKVKRWQTNRELAVRFLSDRGWTAEDAAKLYRDRYKGEYGREALSSANKRLQSAFRQSPPATTD